MIRVLPTPFQTTCNSRPTLPTNGVPLARPTTALERSLITVGDREVNVADWFGSTPEGCDVPGWIPFMTATELGWDREKLTIDWTTGEEYLSSPSAEAQADVR